MPQSARLSAGGGSSAQMNCYIFMMGLPLVAWIKRLGRKGHPQNRVVSGREAFSEGLRIHNFTGGQPDSRPPQQLVDFLVGLRIHNFTVKWAADGRVGHL